MKEVIHILVFFDKGIIDERNKIVDLINEIF
jgi:hypothetical protein